MAEPVTQETALQRIRRLVLAALPDLRDWFVFGGLALVGYGCWQIYPPAAWIVVGAGLAWLGIRNAKE